MQESPVAPINQRVFLRYWLPVIAYVTVIAIISAQPSLKPPETLDLTDKFYHALEYFGLGFLLSRAFRAGRRISQPLQSTLVVLAVGVGIGICDEVFQSFIPGRSSDVFDVLADGTGILLAQILSLLLIKD